MSKYRVPFLIFIMLLAAGSALAQPKARKFDEFTVGIGNAELRWFKNYEEQDKEFKSRIARYAKQLRIKKSATIHNCLQPASRRIGDIQKVYR